MDKGLKNGQRKNWSQGEIASLTPTKVKQICIWAYLIDQFTFKGEGREAGDRQVVVALKSKEFCCHHLSFETRYNK